MTPLLLLALSFPFLQAVFAHDFLLQKRTCNADNCLRGLRGHSAQASPFCSAYLNSIVPSTTVTFTTLCTENPNAVSTACSCLLAETSTTTTITSSSTTPLPTACAASANYGLLYIEDAYDTESAVLDFLFPYDFALLQPGQCCALCSQTVGCYGFTTGSAGQALMYCELAVIQQGLSPVGPGVSPQCPSGRYSWPQADLAPYVPGATGGSGQGPCGIF